MTEPPRRPDFSFLIQLFVFSGVNNYLASLLVSFLGTYHKIHSQIVPQLLKFSLDIFKYIGYFNFLDMSPTEVWESILDWLPSISGALKHPSGDTVCSLY